MNTYIMMFGIANIVAGGPIYGSNKIKFLENEGWTVIVFPTDSGKVYIKPLEKYNNNPYSFLHFSPYIFGKKKTEKLLEKMVKMIPKSDHIIIETGTDYTALWGELLAKKIGARHIVMFLDEKNDNVNDYSAAFYEFKYKREELYSISKKSFLHIFSSYFKVDLPEKNVWNAWCSNSVGNIESDIIKLLPNADYLIGSIGRLDKTFVSNIIEGVCTFADNHRESTIGLCLFGGADNKTISKINKKVKRHNNVRLYISGYIWPIPKSIFSKIDVFVSGGGSANISANMGVTTINMDVITNDPIGFIDNPRENHSISLECGNNKLQDYLYEALIKKIEVQICNKISIEERWEIICKDFLRQLRQIETLNTQLEYYDTNEIWDHKKIHKVQRSIAHLTNYKFFLAIQKTYSWIKGYGFRI